MTCSGCSGAVNRVLTKAQNDGKCLLSFIGLHHDLTVAFLILGLGIDEFSVNLDTQEVIVKGTIPFDDVTAKIAKTGKQVRTSTRISV